MQLACSLCGHLTGLLSARYGERGESWRSAYRVHRGVDARSRLSPRANRSISANPGGTQPASDDPAALNPGVSASGNAQHHAETPSGLQSSRYGEQYPRCDGVILAGMMVCLFWLHRTGQGLLGKSQ